MDEFAAIERLAGAGRVLAARRVAESGAWKRDGDRSAAHWMARKTGTSVGAAVGTLETARRLEELPTTEEALRTGHLSGPQAEEIASAAAADPDAEDQLLDAAATAGLVRLRERCRRVRAAACADEIARHRAIHASRYLRHREAEGAFRMELRSTVEIGGEILAALEPYRERIFAQARAQGRREPYEAYAADALLALARSAANGAGEPDGSGPRATVHVRADHAALVRGHVEAGETCEIPGVGPVPVATRGRWPQDAIVYGILTKGVEVTRVAHLGRRPTVAQRRALQARDPTCVVSGCEAREQLEIDHVTGWALTRTTRLDDLARLCSWHHHLKDPLRLPARSSARPLDLAPVRRCRRGRSR